jgi:type II secretory pathway component PulJ
MGQTVQELLVALAVLAVEAVEAEQLLAQAAQEYFTFFIRRSK